MRGLNGCSKEDWKNRQEVYLDLQCCLDSAFNSEYFIMETFGDHIMEKEKMLSRA